MKEKTIAFYHCHTPLHIGSGTSLDIIDLPIQREAHTDFPLIPSTAIKGVIRVSYGLNEIRFNLEDFPENPQSCPNNIDKSKCDEFFNLFGHGDKEGNIIFTDGKILLFPVKSVKGVFAWITCPLVLERFSRDTNRGFEIPEVENNQTIAGKDITIDNKYLVLEELSFEAKNNSNTNEILNNIRNILLEGLKNEISKDKIAIVSNDSFTYFVKNHTEVNARTKINQVTGTVKEGALWYEELVPAESVFYNLIFSKTDSKDNLNKIKNFIDNKIFQFGGDETLGRGFIKIYAKEE